MMNNENSVQLNLSDGQIIPGTAINEYTFLGRMKVAQLLIAAPDPRDTEDPKKVDASPQLQGILEVRKHVQRMFQGSKKATNVPLYAGYIVETHEGAEGITPPIMLYTSKPLQVVQDLKSGTALTLLPWGESLVAIDGETQLAARHEAALQNPETKNDYVAVVINHGRPTTWARQAFHDLNALAVRPNTALALGMDGRDPLTHLCREIEEKVPFFTGKVNKVRRQLRGSDPEVMTITSLRGACATFVKGINGVQFGTRPVPIPKDDMTGIETAALEWFQALANNFGPAIANRNSSLAGSPTAMSALGAMGNDIVGLSTPAERQDKISELIARLKDVNWSRLDETWDGIAGKYTAKKALALGGSKETAYAVYAALSDPSSPYYTQVRKKSDAKAA